MCLLHNDNQMHKSRNFYFFPLISGDWKPHFFYGFKKKIISHSGKITPVKEGWGGRFQDTLPWGQFHH